MHHLARDSWVGCALYVYRFCTSRNGRDTGSTADYLDDLDRDLSDVWNILLENYPSLLRVCCPYQVLIFQQPRA